MIIKRIRLSGIRSWENGDIAFSENFTAIVGPKGAGKSSILVAFDFALFGEYAATSYQGLLRDGFNVGQVTLEVEEKGKNISITRGLTRSGRSITQDSRNLEIIVNGTLYTRDKAKQLNNDIEAHLGIDKILVENTILTRQEELKSILNMQPTPRKKTVDNLLQLDAFETSWQELGNINSERTGYVKSLKEQTQKYDLQKLSKDYEKVVEELGKTEKNRLKVNKIYEKRKRELDELEEKLTRLEKQKKDYDGVKAIIDVEERNKSNAETLKKEKERQISSEKEEKDKNKQDLQELQEVFEVLWANTSNQEYEGKKEINSLRNWLSELDKKSSDTDGQVKADERSLKDLEKKEKELVGAEDCPYCGQPLSTHKAEEFRKERQEIIDTLNETISENKQLLKELKDRKESVGKVLEKIRDTVKAISDKNNAVKRLKEKEKEICKELQDVKDTLAEIECKLTELREKLPPYDEDLHFRKREERKNLADEVGKSETQLAQLDERIGNLGERVERLSKDLEEGKKAHERYRRQRDVLDNLKVMRKAYRDIVPDLRNAYLQTIETYVQNTYNEIAPISFFVIKIDESYTPKLNIDGHWREYRDLSGGERTDIALAYRIGLGNSIYEARTGIPLELLILDEPTESLGNEDRSIERLARMLSRLKIRQVIAITHDQTFARFAYNTFEIKKIGNKSELILS